MANYNIYLFLSVTGTFSGSNRLQNIAVGDTLTVSVNNFISGWRNWNAYISSSNSSGGTFTPMPAAWTSTYSNGPIVFTSTGQGSGYYTINIYSYRSSSQGGYAYTSGRIYGQVAAGAATYGLSAPTSIQEGTTGTVTISATNNSSGLVYWAATPQADFSPSTGMDYLLANQNGSFSLSPLADNSTEGNETATLRLYSDSARTNQIASTTTTITDQASGGGGGTGGTGTPGSTSHGIEVFSQNGTKVFGTDIRTQNLQYELTLSIGAGATSATYAMADADDPAKCVITTLGFAYRNESNRWTINTSSTGFSVTNNGGAGTVDILAFRIG